MSHCVVSLASSFFHLKFCCPSPGFPYDVVESSHYVPSNDRSDCARYKSKPLWCEIMKVTEEVCDIYGERVVLDFNNKVGKDSTKKAKASFVLPCLFLLWNSFFAQLWYISFDMKKCCLVVFFIWYVLARKRANSRWMSTKTWLTQCACGSGSGLSWPERWKLPTSRTWIGCLRVGTFAANNKFRLAEITALNSTCKHFTDQFFFFGFFQRAPGIQAKTRQDLRWSSTTKPWLEVWNSDRKSWGFGATSLSKV